MEGKGGGEKYKIGDVAKMLGITPEAIRFYENHGIIKPQKDDNTGYRYYDVWDIHMLIRARSYRQFGYSLSDTVKMLNDYGTDEFIGHLEEKEQQIQQEIIWNINLLKRLRQTQEIVSETQKSFGTYSIRTRPAIYRLETQQAYSIHANADIRRKLQEWISKVPFVYPCALFSQQEVLLGGTEGTFTFGLGVDAEYKEFFDLKQQDDIQFFPELTAVYTTIRTDSNEVLTTKRLIPAMEYLKSQGLTLTGDILSRVVLMRKEEDIYVSYHQLWFPFETFSK
ncbi:MerR family transcriptional regulator [Aminipila butyrica]|uniref:MerR family transcriptional regulator n=1 Tax=Aminipila butyrica TaxID=433296 RepID=A0A858BWX1_9FIRM|nr:MerR family transcriptional regulator [Aminipila butyrica]QIB70067.1 MerR family transcriptional regulator [Aminipila butyrica]